MQKTLALSNETRISYWVYHPKAKKTMVLIHGFTGSHEGFQYIIPLLPHIRFIVPDLPGFGASEIGKEDWSIDAIASRLNEFVTALTLKHPPFLLGHSMGGLVASSMLYQAPHLYDKKAILLSPVPTKITANDSRRVGAILGALQYHLGHRLPKIGHRIVKSRRLSKVATKLIMTTTDAQLQQEIFQHHYNNLDYISDIAFYSKLHRDINRKGSIDYAVALRRLDTLLITGNQDNVTPLKHMLKFKEAINPKKFVLIDGVGHLAHYEKAPDVARAISEFIPLP